MFCKNCGTKNEEGVKFCASCGQELTSNKGNFDFKAFFNKYKYVIIGVLAVVLVLIIVVSCSGNSNSPEGVVDSFMTGMKKCDADKVLKTLYSKEEEWEEMSKKEKKEELNLDEDNCDKDDMKELKYKIKDSDIEGKKGTVDVKLTHEDDSMTWSVPVIKVDGKWYVNLDKLGSMFF